MHLCVELSNICVVRGVPDPSNGAGSLGDHLEEVGVGGGAVLLWHATQRVCVHVLVHAVPSRNIVVRRLMEQKLIKKANPVPFTF